MLNPEERFGVRVRLGDLPKHGVVNFVIMKATSLASKNSTGQQGKVIGETPTCFVQLLSSFGRFHLPLTVSNSV
jgi:hypothetical protein